MSKKRRPEIIYKLKCVECGTKGTIRSRILVEVICPNCRGRSEVYDKIKVIPGETSKPYYTTLPDGRFAAGITISPDKHISILKEKELD